MMQVLSGGSSNLLNTAATEYIHFWPTQTDSWNATENTRRQMVSGNGRVKHLRVKLTAAPGSSGTYTFNLRLNGANAGPSVVITDPETTGVDLTNIATTVEGDIITLQCVPSGGASATPAATWCAVYEDTDRFNKCIIMGGINNAMPTLISENSALGGGNNWSLPAAGFNNGLPITAVSGEVQDLYIELNASPGVGSNYQLSMLAAGASQLSVTISGTNTTGNSGATLGSMSRGNGLSMRSAPNSSPTARQAFWGIGVRTDNHHSFMLMGGSSDQPAGTEYNILNGAEHVWTATETDRRILVPSCVITGLIANSGSALGAGDSAEFTIMKNGSATSLTATISTGATTAEDNINAVYCDDGDELSLRCVTGGTLPSDFSWAVVCRKAFYSLPMVGAGI